MTKLYYYPFNTARNDLPGLVLQSFDQVNVLNLKEFSPSDDERSIFVTFLDGRVKVCDNLEVSFDKLAETDFKLYFDWTKWINYLLQTKPKAREPFARSIKSKNEKFVFDATAGRGKDALYMAYQGHHVKCFERSSIVYLLLTDAKRLQSENWPFRGQIDLHYGNFIDHLNELKDELHQSVIYFDPMYENVESVKNKSMPKKEILFFRNALDLQGFDEVEDFFQSLVEYKVSKIVFKRPIKSSKLNFKNYDLNTWYSGKTTRYDLYLPKGPQ